MSSETRTAAAAFQIGLPKLPLPIWMILAALAMGLAAGMSSSEIVGAFNAGWGRAVGEFALILLPSFILAATLSRTELSAASTGAAVAAPAAGAGMICPDTAYAALSPLAGRKRLITAFGAYAGFKLMIPAGPLIVATGLGVDPSSLLGTGLALLIPVWAVGTAWGWRFASADTTKDVPAPATRAAMAWTVSPFFVLLVLLILGMSLDLSALGPVDFFTQPKGALLAAAAWALALQGGPDRQECLESGVRRTASLLLIIGAASAFGGMLTTIVPLGGLITAEAGFLGIVTLFALTVLFKVIQGSSMATFAAVAPVAAPIVAQSSIDPTAAVFAICLGSFIAILPNDSFYWLVRRDALALREEAPAARILAFGTVLQALVGLAVLLALQSVDLF